MNFLLASDQNIVGIDTLCKVVKHFATKIQNFCIFGYNFFFLNPSDAIFNRPGVAGAVLESPPSVIN